MRLSSAHRDLFAGFGILLLSGCGAYLHDDSLQKKTDSAFSTYKAADVTGSIKAKIDRQQQVDQSLVESIVDQENAIREMEISELLDSTVDPKSHAVDRLGDKIKKRIADLAWLEYSPPLTGWDDRLKKIQETQTTLDDARQLVDLALEKYKNAGGRDYSSCPAELSPDKQYKKPEDLPKPIASALRLFLSQCKVLADDEETLKNYLMPFDELVAEKLPLKKRGLIWKVHDLASSLDTQVQEDERAAQNLTAKLNDAKAKVDDAAKGKQSIDQSIQKSLNDLDGVLKGADDAAGAVGLSNYKPSVALASIKFRKTTLCDVLLASVNKSCSGGAPSDAAISANKALGAFAAGIGELYQAENEPTTGALAIALAWQIGREAQAQAALKSAKAEQAYLHNEEQALMQELELLARARAGLLTGTGDFKDRNCTASGLGDLLVSAAPLHG
jgi:hypothetical protein